MSRIGIRPIAVPAGVEVTIDGGQVRVTGPRGALERSVHPEMQIERVDGTLVVQRPSDERRHRALHGLTRTLVDNMVIGVTTGFRRDLEIFGVGYRVQLLGKSLLFQLGYSHPVRVAPPEGISFSVEGQTRIAVQGIDKELVGELAARIRAIRPVEPYKGKGVRYANERVRRKAGKAGKVGGKK
jgi:large subunit ribosomal protein L6